MVDSMVARGAIVGLVVVMAMGISRAALGQGTTTSTTTTTYADGATKTQDTITTRDDGSKSSETHTEYDENGQPTSETQKFYNPDGTLSRESEKTWVWDPQKRLTFFQEEDDSYGGTLVPRITSRYRIRKKYKDDKDTEGTTTQEQVDSSVSGGWRDFDGDGGDTAPSTDPIQPLPPKTKARDKSKLDPSLLNRPLGEEPPAGGTQTPGTETPKSTTPETPAPPPGAGGKTSSAGPAQQKTIAIVLSANAQPGDTITGTATDDPAEIAEMQTIPAFHIVLVPVTQPTQTATPPAQPVSEASSTPASQASGSDTLAGFVVQVNGTKQPADKPLVATLGPTAESIAVELLTNDSEPKVVGQDSVPLAAPTPGTTIPEETGPTETSSTPASGPTPAASPTETTGSTGTAGPAATTSSAGATAPENYDMPTVAKPGAVEVIHGPVSGNANDMQIAVDGELAKILTATPRAVFWRVPADLPATSQGAAHTVVFTRRDAAGGAPKSVTFPLYGVGIRMSEGSSNLIKGQSTPVQLIVSIPQNIPASAWQSGTPPSDLVDLKALEAGKSGVKPPKPNEEGFIAVLIENETPGVVRLGKTDSIVLQLHQKDFTDGSYTYNTTLNTIHAGAYVVRARVVAFLKDAQGQASMGSGN